MSKTPKLEGRIYYAEDWNGHGEHYVFENKWTNEDEWGLECAFKLLDHNGEEGVLINYQALTLIRQWQRLGVDFHFCNEPKVKGEG